MSGDFFKVIVIGEYSVGKSAIMNRLVHGSFTDQYTVTVGVEFESKELEIEGEKVQLQIWDTVSIVLNALGRTLQNALDTKSGDFWLREP